MILKIIIKTKFGDLYIDIKGRQVYYKDETIPMTKREFDIIEFLSLNSGQVFSREYIYEKYGDMMEKEILLL